MNLMDNNEHIGMVMTSPSLILSVPSRTLGLLTLPLASCGEHLAECMYNLDPALNTLE